MKILIVEDSRSERELLKYLLESRFQAAAKFREAQNLETAYQYLSRGDIDCVILDLQLPDSTGKETFEKLTEKFPEVPVVVMTNNKDRNLALEMIQHGAQEFIIKNFTDEEELFRRVLFAIEKHRRTVRVLPEEAASVHRLERASARMLTAQEQQKDIQTTTVETTHAVADLSRRMFTEIQKVSHLVTRQGALLEHTQGTTDRLKTEILEGYPDRPSIKSQVERLSTRVEQLEDHFDSRVTNPRVTPKVQAPLTPRKMKVILAMVILAGILLGAASGAYLTHMAVQKQMQQKD